MDFKYVVNVLSIWCMHTSFEDCGLCLSVAINITSQFNKHNQLFKSELFERIFRQNQGRPLCSTQPQHETKARHNWHRFSLYVCMGLSFLPSPLPYGLVGSVSWNVCLCVHVSVCVSVCPSHIFYPSIIPSKPLYLEG